MRQQRHKMTSWCDTINTYIIAGGTTGRHGISHRVQLIGKRWRGVGGHVFWPQPVDATASSL